MRRDDDMCAGVLVAIGRPVALALAGLSVLGGCQSPTRMAEGGAARQERSALDALRARAESERLRPVAMAVDPSLFSGLDIVAISPLAESERVEGAPARLSLREVLDAATPLERPAAHGEPANDDARLTAQVRYAQGRQKLLAGESNEAIADLQAATRLDPTAAELWRELGNAQYAAGRRSSAATAYKRAVDLGLRDPQVLFTLARDSARADRTDEARDLLMEAARRATATDDPALPKAIHAELALLLAARGNYTAAREAMVIAADLPETFTSPTNMRGELSELYRRRGEMWQQIGDWSSRLGDADGAINAYARASTFPGSDVDGLSMRRMYALLSAGRPAEAALSLLEQVQRVDQCASDGAIALARQLGGSTNLGPMVASAIEQGVGSEGSGLTASQRLALSRVEAALLGGEAARGLRVRSLELDGDVTLVVHDLVGALASEPALRMATATDIANASPRTASMLADALVLDGVGLDALVSAASKGGGATLLQAYVLAKLGHAERALERVESVRQWDAGTRVWAMLARAEFAAGAARWDRLEAALDDLAGEGAGENALARAAAFRAAQRPDRALGVLTGDGRVMTSNAERLLVADLQLRAGEVGKAESALEGVLEADRYDERGYEGLITMYLPTGAKPDAEKLNGTLRLLRETVPQGRVAKFLGVRNALARGGREQVEAMLMEMVRRSPPHPIALELLTGLWESRPGDRGVDRERSERFFREQLERHPESPQVLASLARMLASSGRGEEAEGMLAASLERHPHPTLARLRERIVRETLKDGARADRLAEERLSTSPATVDHVIERADLWARQGDLPRAAKALADGLAADARLTSEQAAVLLNILTKVPLDAKTSVEIARALVEVFERVGDGRLLPVLRIKRLTAAAIAYSSDSARLADEVMRLAKSQPEIGLTAHRPVVQILEAIGARGSIVPFLRELVTRTGEEWREDLAENYAFAVMLAGTARDAEGLLELAPDRGSLVRWLVVLNKRLGNRESLEPGTSEATMRAEIAYTIASGMSSAGREAESEATLALAIRLDETHAMANNDLGYNLVDRGERLEEAEKMLERALQAEPGNANVLDSVAWLRYKRGQLRDEVGDDGKVIREGAITMLKRAIDADVEGDNAIMRDHLGDALWRAGEKDEAVRIWREASAMIAPTMAILAERKDDPSLTAKVYRQVAESLRSKLAAVQANEEPRVAPFAGEAAKETPRDPKP